LFLVIIGGGGGPVNFVLLDHTPAVAVAAAASRLL